MKAAKPALDAQTDQALAEAAETLGRGTDATRAMLPTARNLADAIRVQFPGQDELTARALMAAASMLAGLEQQLRKGGARPGSIAPVLVDILGFAAAVLCKDADGAA
jgi:hypothetical protein